MASSLGGPVPQHAPGRARGVPAFLLTSAPTPNLYWQDMAAPKHLIRSIRKGLAAIQRRQRQLQSRQQPRSVLITQGVAMGSERSFQRLFRQAQRRVSPKIVENIYREAPRLARRREVDPKYWIEHELAERHLIDVGYGRGAHRLISQVRPPKGRTQKTIREEEK